MDDLNDGVSLDAAGVAARVVGLRVVDRDSVIAEPTQPFVLRHFRVVQPDSRLVMSPYHSKII